MSEHLFNAGYLHAFLDHKRESLNQEIAAFERDYLLNASEEDLCKHLIATYTLAAPVIHIDKKELVEHRPINVQAHDMWNAGRYHTDGHSLIVTVPFEGDAELLQYRPSTFSSRQVAGRVLESEIQIQYEIADANSHQFEGMLEADLNSLGFTQRRLPVMSRRITISLLVGCGTA